MKEKIISPHATALAKKLEKIAVQRQSPKVGKTVRQAENPKISKRPVITHDGSMFTRLLTWSRDMEDREGQWSWGCPRDWGDDVWATIIHPHLREYERKTWGEIDQEITGRHKKHHFYDVNIIHKEAIRRLKDLQLDDLTKIFRFRLEAKKRLYGFVIDCEFNTIWYDPDHLIYEVNIQDKDKVRKKQAKAKRQKRR